MATNKRPDLSKMKIPTRIFCPMALRLLLALVVVGGTSKQRRASRTAFITLYIKKNITICVTYCVNYVGGGTEVQTSAGVGI
jgi:hypothetical protein